MLGERAGRPRGELQKDETAEIVDHVDFEAAVLAGFGIRGR